LECQLSHSSAPRTPSTISRRRPVALRSLAMRRGRLVPTRRMDSQIYSPAGSFQTQCLRPGAYMKPRPNGGYPNGRRLPLNPGLNGNQQRTSLKTEKSQTEETCPSASTTNDGLCTKSQRKPSGSATQALLPPQGCTVGSETEVAPASSARR